MLWSGQAGCQQGATLALSSQGKMAPHPISHSNLPSTRGVAALSGPDQDPMFPTSPQWAPELGCTPEDAGWGCQALALGATSPDGSLCAEAAVAPGWREAWTRPGTIPPAPHWPGPLPEPDAQPTHKGPEAFLAPRTKPKYFPNLIKIKTN